VKDSWDKGDDDCVFLGLSLNGERANFRNYQMKKEGGSFKQIVLRSMSDLAVPSSSNIHK